MIIRLLETILLSYCVASYVVCGYAFWKQRNAEVHVDQPYTKGEKIAALVICWFLSPVVLADVLIARLRGNGPGGVT